MDHYDLDGFMDMYGDHDRHNQPTDRNDDPKDFATKAIDSKTCRLPNCHYTEELFRDAQTVFGRKAKHKSGGYDYSDRYLQWDYDKWRVGEKIAQAQTKGDDPDFDVCSVRYYEVILSHFHGKPTIIYHVLAGFNVSDGYSYNVFGYYHPEDEK